MSKRTKNKNVARLGSVNCCNHFDLLNLFLTRRCKGYLPVLVGNLVSVDISLAAWGLVTHTVADMCQQKYWK